MAAKATRYYNKTSPPQDPASHYEYLEQQLRSIEAAIRDLKAAIEQLQTFTGVT